MYFKRRVAVVLAVAVFVLPATAQVQPPPRGGVAIPQKAPTPNFDPNDVARLLRQSEAEDERKRDAERAKQENNGWAILALILLLYFLPAGIAFRRGHHNRNAIFVLNLFLGWTFIGWVAALVWANTQT